MFASVAEEAGRQCEEVRNAMLRWEPLAVLKSKATTMHATSKALLKSCKDSWFLSLIYEIVIWFPWRCFQGYFNHIFFKIVAQICLIFRWVQQLAKIQDIHCWIALKVDDLVRCSKSATVKSNIGWLATAQVFCWSLLNLSEQHSCTFLIDIFPWKHALHCTNPVAKEWALVRFFSSFSGIFFFPLSHTLSPSHGTENRAYIPSFPMPRFSFPCVWCWWSALTWALEETQEFLEMGS